MEVPGSPFGSASILAGWPRCRHTGQSDCTMALQDMEGVLPNGTVSGFGCSDRRKRLRMDVDQENELEQLHRTLSLRGRNFVPIRASPTTFHTEAVKQQSETIYVPLPDDVLVNVRMAEQISYGSGSYFIGDQRGNYMRSSQGHVINLWRYSELTQKLYISRSFLFTNVMDFVHMKELMENI